MATLAAMALAGCPAASLHAPPPAHTVAAEGQAGAVPRVQQFSIGHSVRGRAIDVAEIASSAAVRSVLVVGCIHGNEQAGIAIAQRLVGAPSPSHVSMWILPVLNPDGVTAGTRQNAHLVDLNRNFPWHWQPLGVRGDLTWSGPRALSEPESRAARSLILRARPQITIWFHQPAGLVDLSGGDPRIERRFGRLVGLPVRELTRYPGSAVSWENSLLPGSTAFVVELPPGRLSSGSVARYARAVLTLAAQPT